jgi:hypothetical protein
MRRQQEPVQQEPMRQQQEPVQQREPVRVQELLLFCHMQPELRQR